jgi:hypothetical protein
MVRSVLMVVFGAGASFDSSDYQGHRDGDGSLGLLIGHLAFAGSSRLLSGVSLTVEL